MLKSEKIFSDFYKKNFDKLLRYLDYSYPNLQDSESQLQDTFIKFYELYYDKWDPSQSELMTYFTNYLKMSTLNTIKQKQKNTPVSIDIEYQIGGKVATLKDILVDEDNSNNIDDNLKVLDLIVDKLKGKWIDRFDLLKLHYKGLSYDEIAECKNIPLSTVKNHIRLIRIYFCEEYSKITGRKLEYKKESQKDSIISVQKRNKRNRERKNKLKI